LRPPAVLWWLGLAWLLAGGCAGEPAPGADHILLTTGRPITNGQLDTNPAHQGVVALRIGAVLCSGSLIAARVVLTAGHCAQDRAPEDFLVLIGTDIFGQQTFELGVVDLEVHPDYVPEQGNLPPVNDLALLLLDDSPPVGVTPLPHLQAGLGVTEADIGWPLQFVGFGLTEDDVLGRRMTVTNDLSWVCTTPGGCQIGPVRAVQNTICQDQRPGGPCSGDSGGPAFLMRSGREYVAGVTSYGDEDCLFFGCSVKVDAYQGWIDAFVSGQIGSDCEVPGDCRSGFCQDGVCCDGPCDGPCQACTTPGALGECTRLADGTGCPDGLICNGDETCQAGVCVTGDPPACEDGDPCTAGACTEGIGCTFEPLADGTPCPDDDVCDGANTCRAGACTRGRAPDCDDGDPCSRDDCDPVGGCFSEPLAEGSQCGQGACGPARCLAGVCTPSDPPECDDADPCTRDYCDPRVGCAAERLLDGDSCGDCRICLSNRCQAEPGCKPAGCACSAGGRGGLAGIASWLLMVLTAIGWSRRMRPGRLRGAGKESCR